MKVIEDMLLTEEGWQRIQVELGLLREERNSRARDYRRNLDGSEPGDAGPRYLHGEIVSIERRILQLEEILARSMPVGPGDRKPGVVGVGSRVSIRWEDGEEDAYIVVGPPEVDVEGKRISYESPVGRALSGKSAGGWITVSTPGGESRLEILKVE